MKMEALKPLYNEGKVIEKGEVFDAKEMGLSGEDIKILKDKNVIKEVKDNAKKR